MSKMRYGDEKFYQTLDDMLFYALIRQELDNQPDSDSERVKLWKEAYETFSSYSFKRTLAQLGKSDKEKG